LTEEELSSLETEFKVRLPAVYRATMLDFPVAQLRGNNGTYFWDNARSLSALNKMVRVESVAGPGSWPARMFAIGRADGDDVVSAIDTSDPDAAVWTFPFLAHRPWQPRALEARFSDFVAGYVKFSPELVKTKPGSRIGWVAAVLVLAVAVLLAWLVLSAPTRAAAPEKPDAITADNVRAFFKEALPGARSFQDAFAKAEGLVREWKVRDFQSAPKGEQQHSLPQIHDPAPIKEQLRRWWAERRKAK
jgi:SMI1/KNR4 family protein SUKH-1